MMIIGESKTEQVKLPKHCHVVEEGCETFSRTFIWDAPRQSCRLQKIRDVKGKLQQNVFIDENELIRLEIRQPYTANFLGCPDLEVYKTQYDRLFVIATKIYILSYHKLRRQELMLRSI